MLAVLWIFLALRVSSVAIVKIQNGTIIGSTSQGVDSFRGIPYAEPPTGTQRLRPPQPISRTFGTIHATGTPSACPQQEILLPTADLPPIAAKLLTEVFNIIASPALGPSSEDCLTVNVQRPEGTSATDKLPVVFWIFGGGFEVGSTAMYDATKFIKKSIELKKPVIYVSVNYRVGGFGFLAGKQLQKDGSTNLGLKDQRLGLQWTAENIRKFGGDPDKVTIWGESAGSISVFDQTIINGGDNNYKGKALFRGGIMNSGSAVPTLTVSSAKAQAVYDQVVKSANCSSAEDTLTCLRGLSFLDFNSATNSVPGIFSYESIDLSYLPRPDPSDNFFSASPGTNISSDSVANVPILIGDQEDEGTLFSLVQYNVTSTEQLVDYFYSFFPQAKRAAVKAIVETYPSSPPPGSPFNTGLANELRPQYKRMAALLGDAVFTLTRRAYLQRVSEIVPAWSYLSSYLYGTPILGTFHGSDILEFYDDVPNPKIGGILMTYFINFIHDLNPNGDSETLPEWPQWDNKDRKLMHFKALNTEIIKDDFREKSFKTLIKYENQLRV